MNAGVVWEIKKTHTSRINIHGVGRDSRVTIGNSRSSWKIQKASGEIGRSLINRVFRETRALTLERERDKSKKKSKQQR
jgi:hypothetical protein